MKIAHISDLHICDQRTNVQALMKDVERLFSQGPQGKAWYLLKGMTLASLFKRLGYTIRKDRPELREKLFEDLDRESPDRIVITGDLTNTALPWECEEARKWLMPFTEKLSIVPGNHDVPVFPQEGAWVMDVLPEAPPLPFCKCVGDTLAFIGLNSALKVSEVYRDPAVFINNSRGMVKEEDLAFLIAALARPGMKRRTVFILLHHHVVNFLPRRKDLLGRIGDFFLGPLLNASEVLKVLTQRGNILVLHGHRHVPHIKTIKDKKGKVLILGAGSALHPSLDEHNAPSYHLLTLENGTVKITTKALRNGKYTRVLQSSEEWGALRGGHIYDEKHQYTKKGAKDDPERDTKEEYRESRR